MKTSFIIPAYNEEVFIEDCLRSIYDLEGLNDFEVIVVDNNSTDRTSEIVQVKFPQVKVIKEYQQGTNFARERGFRESNGEILVFFDADIRAPRDWFKKTVERFSNNPHLIALSGPYMFQGFDPLLHIWNNYFYNFVLAPIITSFFSAIFKTPLFFGGNVVVRRWALEKIGGFDTRYRFYGDDTNLGRRLYAIGRVEFLSELAIYSSTRRFQKEGTFRTFYRYTINFLWEAIFHRPLHT